MSAPVYAVSDVHGHVEILAEALREAGLVDPRGRWCGGRTRLWFLGDFFDRGPSGIGVLELVRRLVEESDGSVRALLGNHEILAMGMKLFGSTEVPGGGAVPRSFERSWTLNGGRADDQEGLTEDHLAWLMRLPVVARQDQWLLVHSDTTEYLHWGDKVATINARVAQLMSRTDDITAWWEIWRRMTTRYAFRGDDGPKVARAFLRRLGGRRIVHGHSIVADWLGVDYPEVSEPLLYADGLALGIDGGINNGGPCLLTRLAPVR
ncbi:serine/threonine protein phosphatase [Auraticoccus sp. F435]|uniref:Serine/threonine protein phosphatase n=1 Tax=Auraticoccus cholistanensis TaxID=2656650 RepID=A0A6A9UPF8_9ACTN|nr:serine/threonine protein phosphatase [Auraticoccus cholistanensis]